MDSNRADGCNDTHRHKSTGTETNAADADKARADGGEPDPDAFRIPTVADLDAMRVAKGLSQRDLSRRAGCEQSRFNTILNKDIDPHVSTLRAFLAVIQEAEPRDDDEIERTGPKPTPSPNRDPDPDDFELLSARLHHSPPDAVGEDPRPPERERDAELRTDGGEIVTDGGVLTGGSREVQPVDQPWKDRRTLHRLYVKKALRQEDIAERFGTTQTTIQYWVDKFGLERPTPDYQDEETLREMYLKERLTQEQIAERCECSVSTVSNWIRRFDIPTRSDHAALFTLKPESGAYETWSSGGNRNLFVHRLLAVAEYGFEAVCDKVVHHKNNVGWDNRPENIELLTPKEHAEHHARERPNWGERA